MHSVLNKKAPCTLIATFRIRFQIFFRRVYQNFIFCCFQASFVFLVLNHCVSCFFMTFFLSLLPTYVYVSPSFLYCALIELKDMSSLYVYALFAKHTNYKMFDTNVATRNTNFHVCQKGTDRRQG